jgi:hypothetical protein
MDSDKSVTANFVLSDNTPPVSKIIKMNPAWHEEEGIRWERQSFKAKVVDNDPESGIKTGSCKYLVYSWDATINSWRLMVNKTRDCNGWTDIIKVGEDPALNHCYTESDEKPTDDWPCAIYVSSVNNADKTGGEWAFFGIDWTPPQVGP